MYLALEAFLEVASGAGDPMNCSTPQGLRVDLLVVVKIKPYLELFCSMLIVRIVAKERVSSATVTVAFVTIVVCCGNPSPR